MRSRWGDRSVPCRARSRAAASAGHSSPAARVRSGVHHERPPTCARCSGSAAGPRRTDDVLFELGTRIARPRTDTRTRVIDALSTRSWRSADRSRAAQRHGRRRDRGHPGAAGARRSRGVGSTRLAHVVGRREVSAAPCGERLRPAVDRPESLPSTGQSEGKLTACGSTKRRMPTPRTCATFGASRLPRCAPTAPISPTSLAARDSSRSPPTRPRASARMAVDGDETR